MLRDRETLHRTPHRESMNMNSDDRDCETVRQLIRWFIERLDREEVRFGDEPLSYDGNTRYDIRCYRLQKEAAEHWMVHWGFEPTPGQIMKGFFGAEFERFRRQKMASLPWWVRLRNWCHGPPSYSRTRSGPNGWT